MKTSRFARLFGERSPAVIGMIHVRALPGAPGHAGGMGPILDQALAEAEIYRACGLQALMIENMHDVPYVRRPGPEVLAAMADFYDSLNPEQQQKVRDFMERRRHGWGRG